MGAWLSSCLGFRAEVPKPQQPSLAEHYQRLQSELCDIETLALERVKTQCC